VTRVILTGATGFVGRHSLRALAGAGHDVHAIGRRRGPDRTGVTWHEADLIERPDLAGTFGAETLVHLGWYAEPGSFWTAVENLRWVEASLAMLRAFAAGGGQRVVIAGSCAEYRWSREVYSEDAELGPATLYGAAKHGLHVVAGALAEQLGLSLAWGRLFFLYGPWEAPVRFVPSLVRPLLRGEPAPMSAGTQRRDFMHSADAGAAFAALVDSPLTGPVNVASGEGIELRALAAMIARVAGGEDLLRVGALPMREGDPPALVADVTRLRDELGFRPRFSLGEGLDDVIAWWREQARAEVAP
jgi:nucleoside-diphosphate-sugar epimerase